MMVEQRQLRNLAADVDDHCHRAKEMRGAEKERDVVKRGDALPGDCRFVFIVRLADVELERLHEADANVAALPCSIWRKTTQTHVTVPC